MLWDGRFNELKYHLASTKPPIVAISAGARSGFKEEIVSQNFKVTVPRTDVSRQKLPTFVPGRLDARFSIKSNVNGHSLFS
jgi:hypothetical protein